MPDSPAGAASAQRPPRLVALDAFRGVTVAAMLLVNDPGSWGHMFHPLEHAAWNGWTPTDLIFPFFLFIVGITTQLSMGARRARGASDTDLLRQILRRSALIAGIGLLISWFPFFTWDSIAGVADPSLLQRIADRPLHVRIPGILQRIGVVYCAVALIALRTPIRAQIAIAGGILLSYWAVLTLVPVPGAGVPGWVVFDHPASTLAAWVDRALLDWSAVGWGNHIWAETKTWDPEGPLSTIPAVATAILGLITGRWLASRRPLAERVAGMLAAGAIVAAAGCVWGWVFPINKNLWTSSFVLLTGGLAAITLGVCVWLIDGHGIRRWAAPFVVFGVNPLIAFAGSEAAARLIYSVVTVPTATGPAPLASAVYRSLYAPWLEPRMASLAFAISFVLVWLGVLTLLYRRRIFLKV
ncbi:MAG: acyltransferase family protein [Gemmatimonadales bacterium]